MRKNNRRKSPSFKADAIQLYKASGSFSDAAVQAGVSESALRKWVAQHQASSPPEPSPLSSSERDELEKLRKENKRLLLEREILKKAAAFFAKENS